MTTVTGRHEHRFAAHAQGAHTAFTAAALGGALPVVVAAVAVPSVRPGSGTIIAIH